MNDQWQPPGADPQQWEAYQKIWGDTFTKMFQLGFTFTPDSAPPELMRQMRTGLFQALSQSWDQYLRSPEFMKSTKQWMDSAVAFRKMSNDFLTQVRQDSQGVAADDIHAISRAVRQMETRMSERLDHLTTMMAQLQKQVDGTSSNGSKARPKKAPKAKAKATKPRTSAKR